MLSRLDEIRAEVKKLISELVTPGTSRESDRYVALYHGIINKLEEIPRENRTPHEWRTLAMFQSCAGLSYADNQKTLAWHEKAVANLQNVGDKFRTPNDWRNLAMYQNIVGTLSTDLRQKFEWYERAVTSIENVSEKNSIDWRKLAIYQTNVGTARKANSNWKLAHIYFRLAIDSINMVTDKQQDDYNKVVQIYKALSELAYPPQQLIAVDELRIKVEALEKENQQLRDTLSQSGISQNKLTLFGNQGAAASAAEAPRTTPANKP